MMDKDAEKSFLENGWTVHEFSDRSPIESLQGLILDRLRMSWFSELQCLEDYHLFAIDDDLHHRIQIDLMERYSESGLGQEIIRRNVNFFRNLVGLDLHVQKYPYLRIARPGKKQDNVGYHRDTHYGSSPYELSVHVPLSRYTVEGALGVISGSHLAPDSAYPWTQVKSPIVEKGSALHRLGFVYAPKVMEESVGEKINPIPITVGQALIFSLSIVHGQVINLAEQTRFTTDIRVVNSLSPINWSRSVHQDYYCELCSSPVTEQARRYIAAEERSSASVGESLQSETSAS